MPGADQPEDLRCPCTKKFAEVTEKGIAIGCRGCGQPILLPFAVLTSKKALLEYLSKLPPRKQRFGRRPRKGASRK